MHPSIAVVISTYNNPSFLNLVLNGYLQQTNTNFSIYIADDGSKPETQKLIQHIAATAPIPIQHIWHKDKGFRKSRIHNLTLQQVKEAYVILTDGDCIPHPSLVAVHQKLAHEKTLICGSRVLLSKPYTHNLCQSQQLPSFTTLHYLKNRLNGHINRLLPFFLPPYLTKPTQNLSGIHGCHLSCFTSDLRDINGFDERFEGWGREDSDLVARLFHHGLQRRNLRGAPVLHLWHRENSRSNLNNNDALLQACLDEKRKQSLQGIRELSDEEKV